jgi:hypothetical protein
MGRSCSTYGRREVHTDLRKPEAKRPLGRPWRRWEDNIKMGLQEVSWGINWIYLPQDGDSWRTRLNAGMNFRVP